MFYPRRFSLLAVFRRRIPPLPPFRTVTQSGFSVRFSLCIVLIFFFASFAPTHIISSQKKWRNCFGVKGHCIKSILFLQRMDYPQFFSAFKETPFRSYKNSVFFPIQTRSVFRPSGICRKFSFPSSAKFSCQSSPPSSSSSSSLGQLQGIRGREEIPKVLLQLCLRPMFLRTRKSGVEIFQDILCISIPKNSSAT